MTRGSLYNRTIGFNKILKMYHLSPLDGNTMQRKTIRSPQFLIIQLYSQNDRSPLTVRTQFGIVWVLGERWWVLMTMTVMMMEAMTKTMVKSMYFPISGTALEVEGISSTITSRNTVRDSKTEMLRVIFSPGRHNKPSSVLLLTLNCLTGTERHAT